MTCRSRDELSSLLLQVNMSLFMTYLRCIEPVRVHAKSWFGQDPIVHQYSKNITVFCEVHKATCQLPKAVHRAQCSSHVILHALSCKKISVKNEEFFCYLIFTHWKKPLMQQQVCKNLKIDLEHLIKTNSTKYSSLF